MKEEVLAFIKHFQNEGTIKTFTEGCCYWFAKILQERFQGGIYYNPIDNHFAFYVGGSLFDITGEIQRTQDWVGWGTYRMEEPSDSKRVAKNCILKID